MPDKVLDLITSFGLCCHARNAGTTARALIGGASRARQHTEHHLAVIASDTLITAPSGAAAMAVHAGLPDHLCYEFRMARWCRSWRGHAAGAQRSSTQRSSAPECLVICCARLAQVCAACGRPGHCHSPAAPSRMLGAGAVGTTQGSLVSPTQAQTGGYVVHDMQVMRPIGRAQT